jgi:hypothetical protein
VSYTRDTLAHISLADQAAAQHETSDVLLDLLCLCPVVWRLGLAQHEHWHDGLEVSIRGRSLSLPLQHNTTQSGTIEATDHHVEVGETYAYLRVRLCVLLLLCLGCWSSHCLIREA